MTAPRRRTASASTAKATHRPYDNGLGVLAGTWSAEEHAEFEEATRCLEAIDEDLWLPCGAAASPAS
jgi:hypothetical protein